MYELLPHEVQQNLRGLFEILTAKNTSIKNYDKRITKISKDYPETETLQQIKGVGPLIALSFALIIGDANRFSSR